MATKIETRASKSSVKADERSGSPAAFARLAEQEAPGLIRELLDFLLYNKKWWLSPIVVVLLLVGGLVILGSTGALPFIYTFF
jgi:Family of unknown function (DUF5989)